MWPLRQTPSKTFVLGASTGDASPFRALPLLALIERHLSELWQAHTHSGNGSLRVVLRRAEVLLTERAKMALATFRGSNRDHYRER